MEILDQQAEWEATFKSKWLAYHKQSGQLDWKLYNRPHNTSPVSGSGIPLDTSRIVLISSAGAYLHSEQPAFDAAHPLGDYSIRTFSIYTPFDQIAYAHDHYDHTAVDSDPQVLLPLQHLNQMEDEGVIGELAPQVINFMGYQPDLGRVIGETIPAIVAEAKAQNVRGALLVPA